MSRHRVDTEALDALNAQLRGLLGFTDDQLTQIQQRMNLLHNGHGTSGPWTGDTADAARTTMDTWNAGAQKMRDGLAKMEAAGKTAHDSYTSTFAAILARLDRGPAPEGGPR
ncbi:WXG100 family type VII secretion target [Nocardia flavorosea]|uniref:WXG100 family type VII secretion target n=1 Tax=Nocardia flavorosea TaxID=53429 RepID=UPI00189524BE|nr:WXG100 family type VII secretion target [Nocardia flavorosea]MBF6349007.1 WXG100 family type VII secretion target [Nocardia flavorosea]